MSLLSLYLTLSIIYHYQTLLLPLSNYNKKNRIVNGFFNYLLNIIVAARMFLQYVAKHKVAYYSLYNIRCS